ncbi:peroxidase 43-like [Impatiens glandulifera]|uniref:peroxidase 43-like n=1 Tax=Impatiens glandulifera TaxID=253017 RepID=UPI001FB13245|nr:peroxidase 43-like [Impatiens glandulifera]
MHINNCYGASNTESEDTNLRVGFYSTTCPMAESIVSNVVRNASISNHRIAAILLRLHFHDCFVEGCDGSILIDNGINSEKNAFGHQGVEGFNEIQIAKSLIESECPGIVSCADIVALAARDALFLSKFGVRYDVPTGRRDGLVSNISLAGIMPEVDESIESIKSKFISKGFTAKELVILSGAHSIGTTACFFMPKRLYNFTNKNDPDPSINKAFLSELQFLCPINGDVNARIPLDMVSSHVMDDQILRNIQNGFAVIASDARLYDESETKQVIDSYSSLIYGSSSSFMEDFTAAIVKMGKLGVKTGLNGEIRKQCNSFN